LTRALVAEYNRLTQPVAGQGSKKDLTVREKEVVKYIAEGMSNGEISQKLGISDKPSKIMSAAFCGSLTLWIAPKWQSMQ